MPAARHWIQDVGHQLPDELQGVDHDAAQQGQDEAPRSKTLLPHHGGRRTQIRYAQLVTWFSIHYYIPKKKKPVGSIALKTCQIDKIYEGIIMHGGGVCLCAAMRNVKFNFSRRFLCARVCVYLFCRAVLSKQTAGWRLWRVKWLGKQKPPSTDNPTSIPSSDR